MSNLTENTLQLARLENAGEIQLDWQSIEEIVGSVLSRVRQRDPHRRIALDVDVRRVRHGELADYPGPAPKAPDD